MEVVLGIDLGTSYFKIGLIDRKGGLCGLGRIPAPVRRNNTRHELKAEDFWNCLRKGLSSACKQASVQTSDISAVSYSSQANSFVLLDRLNRPLTPIIIWTDGRVGEEDPAIRELWDRTDFKDVTGLGFRGGNFCAAKIKWFEKFDPHLWSRINRIMSMPDYLTFSLTGAAAGDEGTASLLGLWNLRGHNWWEEALDTLGIDGSRLSKQYNPGAVVGKVSTAGADLLGLREGIPFAAGSLDHHVAAVGAGIGFFADYSESTGTVIACLKSTDDFNPKNDSCMGPGADGKKFYQLQFSSNGARSLEWYRDTDAPESSLEELDKRAAAVEPGAGGLMALPESDKFDGFSGFLCRKPEHTQGHYARALMESTAASLYSLLDSLGDGAFPHEILATGGGARSDPWLQLKADMLGIEIVRTASNEAACYGAGMLAAVAAGWYERLSDVSCDWLSIDKSFSPDSRAHDQYRGWLDRYRREVPDL
jgi:sugar (pentulose or hexulose) kinase